MDVPNGLIGKIFGSNAEPNDTASQDTSTNGVSGTETGTTSGTSDATLDSQTNAPVSHEQISTSHEEKVHEVVDKDIHKDHYHTTVQPLTAREVLPEKHDYAETATQERSYNYEDAAATRAKLDAERPEFENSRTVGGTSESRTHEAAVAGGANVHHHYHETVQPVIEKETVQPSVTHTKVPVHETYQEESVVHKTSTAEPVSVSEFMKNGNTLDKSS